MSPPENLGQLWLEDARSEFAVAASPIPEGAWLSVWCLHAQRAAEKAIKAVLEHKGNPTPAKKRRTHDIARLVAMLNLPQVPDFLVDAYDLTQYAIETHYIDDLPDPTFVSQADLDNAVVIARAVVEWAAQIIERPR